jgi:hypothetical protein
MWSRLMLSVGLYDQIDQGPRTYIMYVSIYLLIVIIQLMFSI